MMSMLHALVRSEKSAIFVVLPSMNVTTVLLVMQSITPMAKEVTFHVCVSLRSCTVINQRSRYTVLPLFILRTTLNMMSAACFWSLLKASLPVMICSKRFTASIDSGSSETYISPSATLFLDIYLLSHKAQMT